MRVSRSLLVLVAAVSSLVPAFGQQATVYTRTKEYDDVRVTKDDLEAFEMRQGPSKLNPPISDIVRVEYKQAPEAYKKALNFYKDGEYERAAQLFEESLENADKYAWLKAYASFYKADSLFRMNARAEAAAAFEEVLKIEPKPRFLPDVYLSLSTLYLSQGKAGAEKAKKQLELLEALAKTKKLDRYVLLADLGLARAELQSDPKKAAGMLDTLVGKAKDAPDVANLARLELGNAYNGIKDYAKAESYFKGIVDSAKSDDPALLAGAFNGLGDALLAQEKYGDSLLAFSKTYALFLDRNDLRDRVGHALYFGGKSFQLEAGRLRPTDVAKSDLYNRRGSTLLRKAAREFANTAGGARAKKDLGL